MTRCNLRQELPKFQKKSLQPLKKIESSSTQYSRWKPKIIARQVAEKTCCTLQSTCKLARNAVVTQIVKRVVSCSTSFICADSASPKNIARQVTKTICYTLQSRCSLSLNTIAMQVARKLHPVMLA